jgi:hypothetical protein
VAIAFVFGGCYSDKGNYDYSSLDEVTIALPATAYDVAVGDKLNITPTVSTSIPESDITYQWELYGANPNGGYKCFSKFAEGKSLDYTCIISDKMTASCPVIASTTKRV